MSVKKTEAEKGKDKVVTKELTILNRFGIHARPAALFVKTATKFQSEILIERSGMTVSAKSIMGLLTLEGHQGAVLKLTATGPDADEAINALADLIKHKFFED